MRVALIGADGQLGTAFQSCWTGPLVSLGHADIEITDPRSVESALAAAGADWVVNTAAYNLVDRAEDEPERARLINVEGPANLARFCNRSGARLVHVSTDYVFGADVNRRLPYIEGDSTGPQGVYAETKRDGEDRVRAECACHIIVRTCGLYGRALTPGKGNFVKTMLRLAHAQADQIATGHERQALRVVDDQQCTPSAAADVAAAIAALIPAEAYGTYHATNSGSTTWYGFACEIFRAAGLVVRVVPISSADFPQKATRPPYSVLDCRKLEGLLGRSMPPWQSALRSYVDGGVA